MYTAFPFKKSFKPGEVVLTPGHGIYVAHHDSYHVGQKSGSSYPENRQVAFSEMSHFYEISEGIFRALRDSTESAEVVSSLKDGTAFTHYFIVPVILIPPPYEGQKMGIARLTVPYKVGVFSPQGTSPGVKALRYRSCPYNRYVVV